MSDEMLILHCSPTLAGLKTGSIFRCEYDSVEELKRQIRDLNRRLAAKGLCILPLSIGKTALIYVYRPSRLMKDLQDEYASSLLEELGYEQPTPSRCIVELMQRLKKRGDFPHEIGLFLGYPPEDVEGFIKDGADGSKCVGFWKVYGDEEKAKATFAKYRKCTDLYIRQMEKGSTIDRLAVAVR